MRVARVYWVLGYYSGGLEVGARGCGGLEEGEWGVVDSIISRRNMHKLWGHAPQEQKGCHKNLSKTMIKKSFKPHR
jgi:hypothetical protein